MLGTTPSEQMFFDGAHLAHVVTYYEHLRFARIERNWQQFRAVRRADGFATPFPF